jgi:hypothetical protein
LGVTPRRFHLKNILAQRSSKALLTSPSPRALWQFRPADAQQFNDRGSVAAMSNPWLHAIVEFQRFVRIDVLHTQFTPRNPGSSATSVRAKSWVETTPAAPPAIAARTKFAQTRRRSWEFVPLSISSIGNNTVPCSLVSRRMRASRWASAKDFDLPSVTARPEEQFILATDYLTGHGVPQDYVQAAVWYRKAADQGFAEAQSAVGGFTAAESVCRKTMGKPISGSI